MNSTYLLNLGFSVVDFILGAVDDLTIDNHLFTGYKARAVDA